MIGPALSSCFAVSDRTPLLSSLCGIEPLFDHIADWAARDKQFEIEIPAEWEAGWPQDIEKPRSFGKRKDVLLGFLCDLPSERPDPSEQPRQFVLRLMRCPQETESFQIDLAVQVHPERDGMCLVSVEVGATTNRRPGGNVLCMPNLIAGLLEDFCCTAGDDGLEIAAQSRPVKEEDADAIKEMIGSPKRLLPVVVADYNASVKLAGSMAGLAHYHYYEDSSAGLRIGLRPGSSHALAHVFWPGAGNDPQLVSSVQLPAQLASASLLRNCAGGVGVWETLQAGKLRRRLTKTEKQQRAADPDAEMRDELAKLSRKCREAEGSAARLEERLKDVQCDLGWLLRADSPLDAIKQMGTDDSRTIESVKDAIDAARCDYASELDFEHIDYHKEADDFAAAKQVFLALKWLALRYVVARRGGGGDDLATSCKEACGFDYAPKQSKTTVSMYQQDYQFKYRGRPVVAEEHLRWGVSRDPRQILRISFYYDDQDNKVVLHYFGRHQRNQIT